MSKQTNSSTERSRSVPKLRFSDFSGVWEKYFLKDIAKVTSGGTPNRSTPKYWNGDIPWITTSLIDFNEINKAEEFITKEGLNNSSAKIFPVGTVLMAMYGQGKTRGKVALLQIEATTNQACAAILINKLIDSTFLFQALSGKYDEVRKLSNDGGQKNLSGDLIKNIKLKIPQLLEQQKIASFLTAVDSKIELLQKKKRGLEQYKKGVMQQIFSQKLRFKKEDGTNYPNWEEKKLGEIATFLRGSALSKSDLVDNGNYKCIHYGELFTKYNEVINHIVSRTNIENGVKSLKGDILMPSSDVTPDGLAQASSIQFDGVILGGDINIIRPTKVYSIFLSYLLNYSKNQIIRIVTGTTVKHIYNKDVKLLEFTIPRSVEEQTQIANLLSAIDDKIALVNTQLENTKQFKKGLLQQMFV